jgi:HEAT repeat protein
MGIGMARIGWLLVGAAFIVGAAAFADDAGKKPAPAQSEDERPEDAEHAKTLEKKLESPNKLDLIAAIEGLGAIDCPTSRKVLMKFISGTPNSEYGSKAVRALGTKGNSTVVDFLCGKDGARSPRVLVAEAACQSLAVIGDKRAVPTLLECMKADKVVIVCAAVEAVVKIDPAADGLADRLIALASCKDDTARRSVATALGDLTSPKVVPVLIALATKDVNSIVRTNACKSIGKLAPFEARKAMEEVSTKDKSGDVRAAASEALGRIPLEANGKPAPGGK